VRGDTIVAAGPRIEGTAARTIDARDQVLAHAFIDVHTHGTRSRCS